MSLHEIADIGELVVILMLMVFLVFVSVCFFLVWIKPELDKMRAEKQAKKEKKSPITNISVAISRERPIEPKEARWS